MSWLSVALIVFVVLWIYERGRSNRLRRENRQMMSRFDGARSERHDNEAATKTPDEIDAAELAELRERVQVLERIATDENSSEARKAQRIAREIESLRGDIARRSSKTTEDLSE
ncbi:hypothetical protein [Erythrobacter rubeus]|uniref:Uncharacterized protein n=1 Tax=Erythrobacter rubeus TaxID=2760803 RepID=A0ABR8KSE4_9SPHN|nr:hypothetical protein [Erythrobacter rubeus]MBD2841167.1 hypothetical protein [Erythrobacter rubeus]